MVRVDGTGKSNSLIQVRGLDKTYRRGGEEIQVLQRLNLDVDKGDFVAFMGPSGSGKTTLLNLLGGLDVPTHGSITVAGDEITHMSANKLTQWRARHCVSLLADMCVISSPATVMLPCVGTSKPPSRLSSVVLPEPLGPMKATKSPLSTSRFSRCRTWISS